MFENTSSCSYFYEMLGENLIKYPTSTDELKFHSYISQKLGSFVW